MLPESERRHDLTFDLLGGFFLAIGIAAVLIPLNRAGVARMGSSRSSGEDSFWPRSPSSCSCWWERRTPHPLIELPVLAERNVSLPLVSQLFLNGPYMAGLVITSLMLGAESTFAYTTTAISLLILPRPIMFALGAWVADRLVNRLGGRPVVVLGCVGIAARTGLDRPRRRAGVARRRHRRGRGRRGR